MKRTLWFALVLSLFSHTVAAQGVVAQGAAATTSDARAWPIKVVFGNAQIDPRLKPDLTATGTLDALNTTVELTVGSYGVVQVGLVNTAAFMQMGFEGTVDGTNWTSVYARPGAISSSADFVVLTSVQLPMATDVESYTIAAAGFSKIRVKALSYTSGSAAVTLRAGALSVPVDLQSTLLTDKTGAAISTTNGLFVRPSSGATFAVSGSVTATGPLTDTQLRATAVPVSGTVIANAGSGTFAVSGPLTDTQLRASAVPVSGTVAVTGPLTDTQLRATAVPVSGTVTATGPLTDTQLRASAVPVSGTVTATGPLTDTQLRATAVPVSGTFFQGTQPVSAASLPLPTGASTSGNQTTELASLASIDAKITTGSASTAGTETAVLTRPITTNRLSSVVAFASTSDAATVSVEGYAGATCYLAAGTLAATMGIEVSFDGTNWLAFTFFRDGNNLATAISLTLTNPNAARLIYPMFGSGVKSIRMRPAAYTSGTAQGFCEAGLVTDPLSLSPAGGPVGVAPGLNFPNQVGGLDAGGLLRQVQLRNSAPSSSDYALTIRPIFSAVGVGASDANTPKVGVSSDSVLAATQSGTWTVQPGNTANTTPWLVKLNDGTTAFTVKAASTASVATDTSVVVGLSPNSPLPAGTNALGKLTANGGVIIGDVNVVSSIPGVAATSLGKAEDAAHTSADTGVMMLGVRNDSSATLRTNADADYGAIAIDGYGAIYSRSDHPNRIRCTVTTSTAVVITAVGTSCAAPGAGLSIYITDISFQASAAGIAADAFPTLKYGTGGTCGTGTTVFWGSLSAAAVNYVANLTTPIKIPANNEVCWISTTAGSKFITLTGYIAP